MRPQHNYYCLNISRHHSGNSGSRHTQLWYRSYSEDEQKIKHRIASNCCKACNHRYKSLSCFLYVCRIGLCHRKRYETYHNNFQIFLSICQCYLRGTVSCRICQIKWYETCSVRDKQCHRYCCNKQRCIQLESEGIHMPLMISLAKILCSEYTCRWHRPKYSQIVHKYELVYDCYSWHLLCTKLSYHNVVQKAYQICDCILDYHWYGQHEISLIKCFVSYIFLSEFMHVCPPFDFSMVLSCNVTILLRPTLFFKYFMYFSLTYFK